MDKLIVANTLLKVARVEHDRDYEEKIKAQDEWESRLHERMNRLIQRKKEISEINGNLDAADDDLVEVNAGGKIVVAKRSTLTQIQGTKFEAIFSGRWDKKLLRDNQGRIFLDVNPTCFRAIVDHLNEMMISSKESPPSPPIVEDECKHPLQHQLEVFGILPMVEMPDSNIIKDQDRFIILHDWLKEGDSDGKFFLLYRGSRDGLTNQAFHSKCDNKGCTLTIIETTCGMVIGGYSNTSWSCSGSYSAANKAFLFVLSGSDILSPCKMKLKNENDSHATCHSLKYGPTFGGGHDMRVNGCNVYFNTGSSGYHPGSLPHGRYTIKEMEVFQVTKSSLPASTAARNVASRGMQPQDRAEPVTTFTPAIDEAINSRRACLLQAEAEMLNFEESFNNEQIFVEKISSGDAQDIIALNVSGTLMVTTRATLCTIKDSVLAQQFDDSKWTEQGCNGSPVREWTPDQVNTWANNIDGLPEEVSVMLYENEITGRELLSLSRDDLKMMGMKRVASVALLLKEISLLEHGTLIEHSPYCFGKILDYLRSKRLHLLGLIKNEPALPVVCDLQKNRFEKDVKYYFSGDAAKFILG